MQTWMNVIEELRVANIDALIHKAPITASVAEATLYTETGTHV